MKFFNIYTKAFQSIYDLATEQYGSADHIDVLITDNPTLNLEDDIAAGTILKIRVEISVLDEAAKKYFSDSGTGVATWDNDTVAPGYTPTTGFGGDFEIYLDGALNQSGTSANLKTETFNISI